MKSPHDTRSSHDPTHDSWSPRRSGIFAAKRQKLLDALVRTARKRSHYDDADDDDEVSVMVWLGCLIPETRPLCLQRSSSGMSILMWFIWIASSSRSTIYAVVDETPAPLIVLNGGMTCAMTGARRARDGADGAELDRREGKDPRQRGRCKRVGDESATG